MMPADPAIEMLGGVPGVGDALRVRRGMEILSTTPRPPVGLTPHSIVHAHDKLQVRYYAPVGVARRTPVILVPSMINRAYILDLEPGRSIVDALARMGHPTYLVDWGVPGAEDAGEDVGYVIEELLHRSVTRVCRHAGAPAAAMLGYCMGGTLAAMYAALHPERLAGFVALNAPVKFSEGGRFRDFVAAGALDVDRAIDVDGLVPVDVMKPAFKMLDPMGNWRKYIAVEEAARDPRKLARVLVRERWLEENVPMTGAFAREFIRNAYQEDRLLAGLWTIRERSVNLAAIRCPVHVVACSRDFITPPAAATPLAGVVSGPVATTILDTGHIGVVVGSEGPRTFYPLLDHFFRSVAA